MKNHDNIYKDPITGEPSPITCPIMDFRNYLLTVNQTLPIDEGIYSNYFAKWLMTSNGMTHIKALNLYVKGGFL